MNTKRYRATRGIDYLPKGALEEIHFDPGDVVSQIPSWGIIKLLERGALVEEEVDGEVRP